MTPRLNRKLVLEHPEIHPDGAGGYDSAWVVKGFLWGEITARTGREQAQGGAPVSRMNFRIVVRAAPYGAPDRPQPQQRFREGDRIFLIEAVAEEDADNRYLTCFATEEVAV
ncbi:head-tail adaptor protein [Sulfitobacter sp. LCG007]